MEEQKNQIDEQVNFVQLLKELAETQTTLAKIDAQLAVREGKDQIRGVVDSTRANLEKQAKKFGANLKQIEEDYKNGNADKKGILEEYEACLNEINETYETLLQDALERKSQLEADEQDTMLEQKQNKIKTREARKEYTKQEKTLKSEIVNATKEGDLETAQQKIEELQELTANNPVNSLKEHNEELQTRRTEIRQLIEDVEEEYAQFMEDRKAEIDKVTEDKNNKLAIIPKQNIFQKVIGSTFNKFNGTKKFMKNVMKPLQSKIATIKEENIPQIKQMISEKRQEFSEKIQDARVNVEETVQGKVEEYALKLAQTQQKAMETVTNMRDAVVGRATEFGQNVIDAKDNIVQGAKDKMETAAIYGMEAKDFAKDKMETAAIYGMEAKDFAKDKMETAAIYGMEAKDKLVQGVRNTKDAIINGAKDTRDAAKSRIEQTKNSVVTHVTSTVDKGKRTFRNVIGKGYEVKMNFIQKAQNRLNEKQAEIAQKMQILNPDKTVQDQGTEIGE